MQVPTEIQKQILADIELQAERSKMTCSRILNLYGISRSTFYGWNGQESDSLRKRRNLLSMLPEEEKAVIEFRAQHRKVGYRKLAWLMNDAEFTVRSDYEKYQFARIYKSWTQFGYFNR